MAPPSFRRQRFVTRRLLSLAIAVNPHFSYTSSYEPDRGDDSPGSRDGEARSPGPAPAGDHPRDPRHRPRRDDRGGRQRPQPGGGGAAPRRAAAVALQVLPVAHGDLR